jgi:type IV secretion system protein VirB1
VVRQESGGNPLLIHSNTSGHTYRPKSPGEAVALAGKLIRQGHSVDLGLAQINSRNLSWLGLDVQTVFDPCRNLGAAQTVLLDGWKRSGGNLRKTLALYNTGKPDSQAGVKYAARVYSKAGGVIPAITDNGGSQDGQTAYPSAPPRRVKIEWTPAASPLQPHGDALTAHG